MQKGTTQPDSRSTVCSSNQRIGVASCLVCSELCTGCTYYGRKSLGCCILGRPSPVRNPCHRGEGARLARWTSFCEFDSCVLFIIQIIEVGILFFLENGYIYLKSLCFYWSDFAYIVSHFPMVVQVEVLLF